MFWRSGTVQSLQHGLAANSSCSWKFQVLIPLSLFWNIRSWFYFHFSENSGVDTIFLKFLLFQNFMWGFHFYSSKISCGDSTFTFLKFHVVMPFSLFWNFLCWCNFHSSKILCGDSTFLKFNVFMSISLFWNIMWWFNFHSYGISCGDYEISCGDSTLTIQKSHVVFQLSLF